MEKIKHFSHTHTLLLKEEQKNYGNKVLCSGCEEPISGPVYCCPLCNYVLHKSCTELPPQMRHPMHPQHPLTLLSTSPYNSGGYICSSCEGLYNNFVYHCSPCEFDLDMSCASLWRPDDGHRHAFIFLTNPQSFFCYACGEEATKSVPRLCTICQIWVHSSCSELPRTIRINGHHHRLKLTYSLHQVYGFRNNITCGACKETINTAFGGYFCSTCRYATHLKCPGQHSKDALETQTESGEEEEEEKDKGEHFDSENCLISHHGHTLELTLLEQQGLRYAYKICDGCIRPIKPPFFSCAENCGFFLHQSCAKLPRTIEHVFHTHPLILLIKAPHYDGIYRCDGCKSLSNGFVYRCEECQFDLDICCGSLPETLKHETHRHQLRLEKSNIPMKCKGCGLWSKHVFACDASCDDFVIDCGCATLPSTTWHVYDKHPLFLTYVVEGGKREMEYICGICKEKSSQEQLIYYYCDDCDFAAHPYCVIGKYSKGVKFGGTFQYDAHLHPLVFFDEIEQHPTCEACGECCNSWILECGQCKCYFHREGQCFWEQFKKSTKYLALSGTMRKRYAANILAATPNVKM